MKIDQYFLMKFGIPIGLAIAAAIFQSLAIRQVVIADEYFVLTRDLSAGDIIDQGAIRPQKMAKNFIPPGAISAKDSSLVVGTPVRRQINSGHLLLSTDLQVDISFLDIAADELPLPVNVSEDIIRSSHVHVGQMVYFLFHNQGDTIRLGEREYPAQKEIEVGPFRITSIGAVMAPWSDAPDEKVRKITVAVKRESKVKPLLLEYDKEDSEIKLRVMFAESKGMQKRKQDN